MGDAERRGWLLSLVRAGCLFWVRTRAGRLVSGWCALVPSFFWCAPGPAGWLGWGEASTLTPAISAFSFPSPFQRRRWGHEMVGVRRGRAASHAAPTTQTVHAPTSGSGPGRSHAWKHRDMARLQLLRHYEILHFVQDDRKGKADSSLRKTQDRRVARTDNLGEDVLFFIRGARGMGPSSRPGGFARRSWVAILCTSTSLCIWVAGRYSGSSSGLCLF